MFDSASANPNASTRAQNLKILGTLVVTLILARIIGSLVLPIYDDAFITYRYARNLASGHGFVYQAGEWVLGATCPAFGVLVSFFSILGLKMPTAVVVMNIVCDALTLVLMWKILVSHNQRNAAILFGFFFALSPILTRVCVGGMEMNLFLLLCLSAIWLFHRGFQIPAVILASACYFLRPEGVLLAAIFCGLELFSTRQLRALRLPLISLAILIPPLLLIHHFYGHILPQSVMAKSHVVNRSVLTTAQSLLVPDALGYLLLPLAIWGAISFFRGANWRQNSVFRTLFLWFCAYLAAYLVARPHVWSWYAEPIQFVQTLFAALGLAHLGAILAARKTSDSQKSPLVPALVLGVLAIGFWSGLLLKSGPSATTRRVYRPLEAWSAAHLSAQSTLLAEDIGAIGYYSNARIYDAAGLIWPPALDYDSTEAMIRDRQPDYLLLNADRQRMEMMQKSGFNALYRPLQRFSVDNQTQMQPDPALYSAVWKQDYILFGRRAAPKTARE